MRRARAVLLLLAPVLLLAGCSAMFDFNLFKDLGLDPVKVPTPADYAGPNGLNDLADDLTSPAVIDALKADPAAKDALEDFLEGKISGDVDTPEEQQAAVLIADLELKVTDGEDLVNNIIATLMSPIDTSVKVVDLLRSIVPPEVAGDRTAFTAMINGLLIAHAQYQALGQALDPTPAPNGDGIVDPGKSLYPGANAGDIAQKAMVAFLAAAIVSTVDGADAVVDQADAINQMFNLLYDEASLGSGVTTDMTMSDPYGPTADERALNSLKALYDAAGLEFTA